MKRFRISLVACSVFLLSTCATGSQPSRIHVDAEAKLNPWTHLDFHNDPDNFQFAIVADRTGGHREGVFLDALRKLNLLEPEFVISVGDLIEGNTDDPGELAWQWDEFFGLVDQLEMPFFFVPGDNDITSKPMETEWLARFGRTYYHFVYRNVLFLCLDSEDPPVAHVGEEQIRYVGKVLRDNDDVRWTFVIMHTPLWEAQHETGWERVEELLQGRPYTVIAGHHHNYLKRIRRGQTYIKLATTGGLSLPRGIEYFGDLQHVVWVTMTDRGPKIANLALDGIFDEDLRTPEDVELVGPLLEAVAVMPVFFEGPLFTGAATEIHLTNGGDIPMTLQAVISAVPELQVSPRRVERVLAPNSVETVSLELTTSRPLEPTALSPVRVEWTTGYAPPERKPVEVKGTSRLLIEGVFSCLHRTDPVVIDGRLDEWPELQITCNEPAEILYEADSWSGPDDCSFKFSAAHDDRYVYLVIDVLDDEFDPKSPEMAIFMLDVRPASERSPLGGAETPPGYIQLRVERGEKPSTLIQCADDVLAEQTQSAVLQTDYGCTAEFAVPVDYLNQIQRGEWKDFQLNVVIGDIDPPGWSPAVLMWRPAREGAATARFGVFDRR